jgi:hypothetical protein
MFMIEFSYIYLNSKRCTPARFDYDMNIPDIDAELHVDYHDISVSVMQSIIQIHRHNSFMPLVAL